ncbi:MAG TPA: transglutaminaseTgpA domain-containing protein [Acidimicrobiales bacterium]|nr:transglutaminaseTgpA domain-containing protein [Acidimicrobiales bacterium]
MSELALLALVMVEAAGFGRVFRGAGWEGPVLATPLAVMSAMALCRRFRLPWGYSAVLALVVTWVVPAELVLRPYLQAGLPLPEAFSAAGRLSASAAGQFLTTATPAPTIGGFVLWAAWAMGATSATAYLLAYAAESAGAVLAPLVVFAVCCALSGGTGRYTTSAATAAAVVLFLAAHPGPGVWPRRRSGEWQHRRRGGWRRPCTGSAPGATPRAVTGGRLLFTATPALVALGAIAACLGVTPVLGQEGNAPAGWHRLPATQQLLGPDPLVSMRAELYAGSRLPAFVVSSTLPSYWSLTSLDYFDGTNWQSTGPYSGPGGPLPGPPSRQLAGRQLAGNTAVHERFRIQGLSSPWLPVGFQPRSVWGLPGVSYNPSSSTLLVSPGTAEGTTYQVLASESPALADPGSLDQATPLTTWDRAEMDAYLQIPPGIPDNVTELAARLTAGKMTEYEKASAIEAFFHRPPFVYTLGPPPYPNGNDISGFLFATHAGYCQQYATAFAVLARLAGLPTRIAVGFTTGTSLGPGEWEVSGADAHAWPEVWFPRAGWVPFEPTPSFSYPGRAKSGDQQGTGGAGGPNTGTRATQRGSARGRASTKATSAASTPHDQDNRGQTHLAGRPRNGNEGSISPFKHHSGVAGSTWGYSLAFGTAAAGAVAAASAGYFVLAKRRRGQRRRDALRGPPPHGQAPAGREGALAYMALLATWQRTEGRFARLGLSLQPGETPAEWSERVGRVVGTPQDKCLAKLVTALYAAAFGGALPEGPAIDEINRDCTAAWRAYKKRSRPGVVRRVRHLGPKASGPEAPGPAQATG